MSLFMVSLLIVSVLYFVTLAGAGTVNKPKAAGSLSLLYDLTQLQKLEEDVQKKLNAEDFQSIDPVEILLKFAWDFGNITDTLQRIERKVDNLSQSCRYVNPDTGTDSRRTTGANTHPTTTTTTTTTTTARTTTAAYSKNSCTAGWLAFDDACYYVQTTKERLTFDLAKEKCQELHPWSHLITLDTMDEFRFFKEYLQTHYPSYNNTDSGWMTSGRRGNGDWIWDNTGDKVDQTVFEWGEGQPDSQNCLSFWPKYGFKMADVFCRSFSRQFICEVP